MTKDRKLSPKEATELIHKTVKEGNIKLAEKIQIKRKELQPYLRKILNALKVEDAFLSDLSYLEDFGQDCSKILSDLDLEDDGNHTIWHLAERLYLQDQG